MKGDLEAEVEKGGKTVDRRLNPDRVFTRPMATPFTLKGRALLWVRNVGHLMTNPAILRQGRPRDARRPDGCDGDGAYRAA
jgi:malate synthase